ncbi:hypothetical protein [Labrys wisconsinensis]|uniref:ATP synthase F0 subunit 8 n=1 Tax=Labrys wisconsinensis TaxID=425677 RepID=A0ABU0J3R6_9HYPH|nr:hypothetical protein [Labrys wisconsinensis]MDQ0468907.1 hypothetical protein [Labrys wisconsinensis]
MVYVIIIAAVIAAYLALQWLITPLDSYLSARVWRNAVKSGKRVVDRRPRFGKGSRSTPAR